MTLQFVDDVATAIAYAVVFGLANASMHVNVGYLWADYFGRRHLGSIQGTGQTCLIVGASLGPLPFSLSLDLTGDYSAALTGSAVLSVLLALVAALFLRYPRQPASNPGLETRPA
jgi:MFS family permease